MMMMRVLSITMIEDDDDVDDVDSDWVIVMVGDHDDD